jgi:hypothetical protein
MELHHFYKVIRFSNLAKCITCGFFKALLNECELCFDKHAVNTMMVIYTMYLLLKHTGNMLKAKEMSTKNYCNV